MSDAIITVEGLGKRYRLGASRSNERYATLRDSIAARAGAPFRALPAKVGKWKSANGSTLSSNSDLPSSNPASQDFWALRGVSFEVKQGEVLGIIRRKRSMVPAVAAEKRPHYSAYHEHAARN